MLTLYLAALIFGLGTLLTQLLLAPSADVDAADSLSLDAGGDADSGGADAGDADAHPEGSAHPHADALPEHSGARSDWAGIFLSLRFYTFAAMTFGLVGAPVTWLGSSRPATTFAAALGAALLAGFLASLGFRVLGRQTLGSGADPRELVGHVGRVLLACEKGRRGKVRLNVRGQTIDYFAVTDEAVLGPGTTVIVQEVLPDHLVVCAAPIELLPE